MFVSKARLLRVNLSPGDVRALAELREKFQAIWPDRAVTDSDVVRRALTLLNDIDEDDVVRMARRADTRRKLSR